VPLTLQSVGPFEIPSDLTYVGLLFALFVVPKAFQRYRIPSAITSLGLGAAAGASGFVGPTDTVQLLATFGIVALFLFAGLEIDGGELRRDAHVLIQYGVIWLALVVGTTYAASRVLELGLRPSALLALAVLTPSTGFILSSLEGFGLHADEAAVVKRKAITAELLSLTALFVTLQSMSVGHMVIATGALLAIVIFIPVAFRLFATAVAPYAPRSEFAFLLMVAVVCAHATHSLGVYYLVGAFLVGVAAQRFRSQLPAMSSQKMVDALEAFGSVFIPFYFFQAGLRLDPVVLRWPSIVCGVVLLAVFVPLRILVMLAHRGWWLGELQGKARRVGLAMVPTLVFSLVLADMLRTTFDVPPFLVGGIVFYAVVNTTLPAFSLRSAPPEFERVGVAEVEARASAA